MMADFDWVIARADCSLTAIFERLKIQIEEDVDRRNSLRGTRPPFMYGFRVVNEGNVVAVILEGQIVPARSITFRLGDNSIEVSDSTGKIHLTAVPTLSDDGKCRLRVNGTERELWQLRKAALEELLFSV